jgi:3-methylfumaryl-CoA hydratase
MQNPVRPLAQYVESWNPEPTTDDDPMLPGPAAAMSALLNRPGCAPAAGDPLPPLWHWFYFLHWPKQEELGADGHPRHGHFLPPIPDRQRMFAGGRCQIVEPLRLGERAERISTLHNVAVKHGRTGELVFVTQRNEFRQRSHTCLVEEQDIVYRSGPSSAQHPDTLDTSAAAQLDEPWQLALQPDPTLLFRFSALTANSHRIHYDTPYVREEEGYPGLVVHGPLLAVLMLELVRRSASQPVRSLSFRLRSPVFVGEQLVASGTPSQAGAELHVATHREKRHATAEVTFA